MNEPQPCRPSLLFALMVLIAGSLLSCVVDEPAVVIEPEPELATTQQAVQANPTADFWDCLATTGAGDTAAAVDCVPAGCSIVVTTSTRSAQPACEFEGCSMPRIIFTCADSPRFFPSFSLCPNLATSDRIEVAMEVLDNPAQRAVLEELDAKIDAMLRLGMGDEIGGEGDDESKPEPKPEPEPESGGVLGVELANFNLGARRTTSLDQAIHSDANDHNCANCHSEIDSPLPTPNRGILSEAKTPDPRWITATRPDYVALMMDNSRTCMEQNKQALAAHYGVDVAVIERGIRLADAIKGYTNTP